ncbi:MAG: 4-hydroxy-tetrahydrodipicolinate synthase [Puniceicoccales bacterium]|jgi:4-hydroxy-tetrahydrodipicolinate synthase|nr:4-hydroxy-tetrahydrodipicolinate synthase [Puniceicoccales bacterium]
MSTTTHPPYTGAYTALVTPFDNNNEIHWDDLRNLVEHQITNGINGLVSVGTTGESPTLDTSEHLEVIARTLEYARHRVPVLAGTGSNSTTEAIALTRHADQAGADAFLLVAPYYNRPTQEGIYEHFHALADSTAKPIILYSIPSRCGVEIATDTIARLHSRHPNIIGIKEAGGSCDKVSQIARTLGPRFLIHSGDDALTLPFIALGAHGVISVASNWLPREITQLVHHARTNNTAAALHQHNQLADTFKKLSIETNPVPIKHILARTHLISTPNVRLPLTPLTPASRATLDAHLNTHGKNN